MARKLGETAPLSNYLLSETSPGSSVQTDSDWETWLAGQIGTEYHPAMSCAMLPQEQGGFVDAKLVVYGTQNVRVADASVFPALLSHNLSDILSNRRPQKGPRCIRIALLNGLGRSTWPIPRRNSSER